MSRLAYSILIVLLAYFTNAQQIDGFFKEDAYRRHIDVVPLNYGVEIVGGVMTTLIPKMSTYSIKKSKVFTTTRDQQTNVTIKVFMGNWRLAKNCMLLGELNMTGIPPASRGIPRIEVTFVLDDQYTLFVKAEDKASGKSEKIEIHYNINDHYSCRSAEIMRMILEDIEREEREERERIVGRHNLKSYAYNIMKNLINGKDQITKKLEAEEKELIETSTSDNGNAIAIVVDEDMQSDKGV